MHRTSKRHHFAPAATAAAALTLSLAVGGCSIELVSSERHDPAGRSAVAASPAANEPLPQDEFAPAPTAEAFAAMIEHEGAPAPRWAGPLELASSESRSAKRPRGGAPTRPQSPNVRQVTFAHEGGIFDPAVSRDGEFVVYASTQHRPTSDIYAKRIDSRVQIQLTSDPANDAMPAISPDGTRIAFASDRAGSWDIYVMPASGGRPLQITSDPSHEIHPSWSPDGRRLVFNRRGLTSGRWELWVVDVANNSTSQFLGYGLFPEWCPTPATGLAGGDRILFQRGRERGDRAYALWTLEYDGANATNFTEIASSPTSALINPTWSPDGKRLLYASVPQDGDWTMLAKRRPEWSDLWMIDVDGTNLVRLTEGDAVDLMPTWAGNQTVLFASDRGGSENLWSLDVRDAIAIAESGERGRFAAAGETEEGE